MTLSEERLFAGFSHPVLVFLAAILDIWDV